MLYAVLLLGLLPLALFSDGSESEPEEGTGDSTADDVTEGSGDLLDEIDDTPPDQIDPDEVLQPSDEIDVAHGGGEDPEDVIYPVDVDDAETPSDGKEGGILDPTDEDDVATPLGTIEIEKLDSSRVTQIETFDVASDVLCLFLDNDPETDVSTRASADGEDTEVYLGQDLVAVVRGVSDPGKVEINTAIEAAA